MKNKPHSELQASLFNGEKKEEKTWVNSDLLRWGGHKLDAVTSSVYERYWAHDPGDVGTTQPEPKEKEKTYSV